MPEEKRNRIAGPKGQQQAAQRVLAYTLADVFNAVSAGGQSSLQLFSCKLLIFFNLIFQVGTQKGRVMRGLFFRSLGKAFNLLAQGLHILAGSPKVGKSWLALWLAVTVSKGEPVWGMAVKPGSVLYLCLEDSQLRIQNRLFQITEDAPATVHFCTEAALLGYGLEEQLENFLAEHPDTVLVIIDTLQMVRSTHYDNTYANDYRDLSVLCLLYTSPSPRD